MIMADDKAICNVCGRELVWDDDNGDYVCPVHG